MRRLDTITQGLILFLSLTMSGCGWGQAVLAWPPQDTWVHPCLYSPGQDIESRPDEQFFVSQSKPYVVEEYNENGYRSIEWGPYYFISRLLIVQGPYIPEGKGEKVWGLQWYRGIAKVDGTRTFMLNNGSLCGIPMPGYVYTTTDIEMRAFRFRELNHTYRGWEDQAGS